MQQIPLTEYLQARPYPGRGIVLGRSADGARAEIVYFIMGRSENSRNRVFAYTGDGIRTQAFDKSRMTDPSLIIYHPVRRLAGRTIVTNGNQTDTIQSALAGGGSFAQALLSRSFEPDAPNYTPRISGLMELDGRYQLSILKSLGGDPSRCSRQFFQYDAPRPGLAHILHTYRENTEPLPSYEGDPAPVSLPRYTSAQELAQRVWESLNGDNRVSLYVCLARLSSGERDEAIINRYQEV